jgi:hypothetical protein
VCVCDYFFAEEIKALTSEKVASPHTSCEMRITRSTRARGTCTSSTSQSSEMVSPVLSKRSTRRAFKVNILCEDYIFGRFIKH